MSEHDYRGPAGTTATPSSETSGHTSQEPTPRPAIAKAMQLRPGDGAALAALVAEHPAEGRGLLEFAARHFGNATVQAALGVLRSESSSGASPVQMERAPDAGSASADVHAEAARGIATASAALPHASAIQTSFGPEHDLSAVRAHVDPASTTAIGANAYATGRDVVFADAPDLHTAAHEAAHVVQQAKGVNLDGGVGEAGDAYEQHADAVADRVVAGQSAADLLGAAGGSSATTRAVQLDHRETIHPTKPIDPMLVLEPDHVELASTVGQPSHATVRVVNPDREPHTLDPAAVSTADPYVDLDLDQATSIVLAPGGAHDLPVRFRPSRAGRVEQQFRIGTDRGEGPSAVLHVAGVGRDANTAATEARIADQDYDRDLTETVSGSDPQHGRRIAAERAVHDWAKQAIAYHASFADWTRNNWEHMLGETGGDIPFSEPGLVHSIVVKAVSKGVAKMFVEGEGGMGSKLVEKSLEKIVEFVIDKLSGERPTHEEAALEATQHVAKASRVKGNEIAHYREAADLLVRDAESGAAQRIAHASTPGEIDRWRSWADAQRAALPGKPDPSDLELARALLAEWVLQRAGSPSRPGEQTNGTAWKHVRDDLTKSGTLRTIERQDLFVHQCRGEWDRLALDRGEIEQALGALDHDCQVIEAEIRAAGGTPAQIAAITAQRMNDRLVTFHHSAAWRRTADAFVAQESSLKDDDLAREFLGRPFILDCNLRLKADGGGVYVEHFQYDLKPERADGSMIRLPTLERVP